MRPDGLRDPNLADGSKNEAGSNGAVDDTEMVYVGFVLVWPGSYKK